MQQHKLHGAVFALIWKHNGNNDAEAWLRSTYDMRRLANALGVCGPLVYHWELISLT